METTSCDEKKIVLSLNQENIVEASGKNSVEESV